MSTSKNIHESIGTIKANVEWLVDTQKDMKKMYDAKISDAETKITEIHTHVMSANLPQLKQDVESLKSDKKYLVGGALGAGAIAGSGAPWLTKLISHLF